MKTLVGLRRIICAARACTTVALTFFFGFYTAANATPLNFSFSFTNNYRGVGAAWGAVTGRIIGLTDNATSSAAHIYIDTWPSDLTNLGSYIAPIDATLWNFQYVNYFTVSGGVITSMDFHADNLLPTASDRLYLSHATCSCSYLSIGSGNFFKVCSNPDNISTALLPVSTTPLPATLPLFASGLGALGLFGWRRKRKARLAA